MTDADGVALVTRVEVPYGFGVGVMGRMGPPVNVMLSVREAAFGGV